VQTVKQREDIQLNKFFLPFSGWFLSPRCATTSTSGPRTPRRAIPPRWWGRGTSATPSTVHVTLGGGITSLPSVRSTEGQFPYWLGVDDRLIADEFFRGSYTSGIWLKGELTTKFKYMAMLGTT
jgi:hypothetical protein